VGLVAAGLTGAMALGIPLGTAVAGAFGWRATMLFVAALGVLGGAGMLRLPRGETPRYVPLRVRLAPLRRGAVIAALASVTVAVSGAFMFYQYVAPVAIAMTGAGPQLLAALIAVAGVSGAIGTWLGGRATDRFGPERTTLVAVSGQTASILGIAALAIVVPPGDVPLLAITVLFVGWSMAGWAFNPAMQLRLISVSGDAGAEVVGLNSSALFLGIAVAGGLGGLVLAGWGPAAIPLGAGVLCLLGLVCFAVSFRRYPAAAPRDTVAAHSS
ncbi:MAG: MFS transporter, partial [Stackebrandtia sp.]